MSRCSYSSVVVVCLLHTGCHWTPTGQNIDNQVNIDIDRTSRTKPPTKLLLQALYPVVMASYVSHRKSYNDMESVGSTPHPQWLNYTDNISRVSPCHAFDLAYPGDRSRFSVNYQKFCLVLDLKTSRPKALFTGAAYQTIFWDKLMSLIIAPLNMVRLSLACSAPGY